MAFNNGVKVALVAATAGLLLSACSADSDAEASASAEVATPDFAAIAEDIDTRTGCDAFGGTWEGGESADADAAAGWVYTCDADGDGTVETTLSIYATGDDLATGLTEVEAAAEDTAILAGGDYIVATTDSSHFATVADTDVEIVRELPVAE
ncbi:hypothetical protein [Demequina mangrovi]|uniref:Lipoprotein n=1 Tax=Demequina mangrovi TaxID=1043493 RepID=A0A1H6UIR1_9MICO|nr:hypothetical protein [Demequina mangrovi]SEI92201.1 hypothetical protein SAMN05421637_0422 [Demequina mangrovi]